MAGKSATARQIPPELSPREVALFQEIEWRLQCQESLVEFAQSMPIPGVPQDDNHDDLVELHKIDAMLEAATTEEERKAAFQHDDGRYNDRQYIDKISTDLADHHILLLNLAQNIIEGNLTDPDGGICKRGMAFMPPGSAKSTYWSVVTPAWAMGKYPGNPIILTSYADMLAKKHGKRARQLCMSPEYKAVFDATLDPHTKAADQWALTNGSEYLSAGLQSGLTGNRAFGAIWDDPVKGRRAAESLAEQVATWDAYKDDFRTRKTPLAWELGVMTRWHERDLAGMILPDEWSGESGFFKCKDGYWWYIMCVQAEAEHESDPLGRDPGEYIWTDWFNTEGDPASYWAPFKLDTRSWGSLYQQIPTPPEGTFFKESWVRRYDHLPQELNIYMSGDYAVTRDEDADDPDFTSLGIWGMDSEGQVYFLDGWHGKVDAAEWTDLALDFVENRKPLAHIAGGGPIRRGTEPWFKRRMVERKAYVRLVWYPETHGKEENCRTFQAMMQAGMVHWPHGNEEAEWIIRHLIGFGTLRYDDAVDMCGMFGRHVAKLWEAKKPKAVEGKPVIKPGSIPIQNLMPKKMRQQMRKRS